MSPDAHSPASCYMYGVLDVGWVEALVESFDCVLSPLFEDNAELASTFVGELQLHTSDRFSATSMASHRQIERFRTS